MADKLADLHNRYLADPTNKAAENDLIGEVAQYAYAVCRRRSIVHIDAEETSQDAALSVHRDLAKYDPSRASFRTWVHRMTLDQVSINRRRAEVRAKDDAALLAAVEDHRPPSSSRDLQTVRRAAGNNTQLIDMILLHGDIDLAAHRLGITPLAAKRRLRRIGRKINIE